MALLMMNLRKCNGGRSTQLVGMAGIASYKLVHGSNFSFISQCQSSPRVMNAENQARTYSSSLRLSTLHFYSMETSFRFTPDGRRGMAKKGGKSSKKDQDEDETTVVEAVDTSKIIAEMTEVRHQVNRYLQSVHMCLDGYRIPPSLPLPSRDTPRLQGMERARRVLDSEFKKLRTGASRQHLHRQPHSFAFSQGTPHSSRPLAGAGEP
jgi:hypothetical protein